MQVWTGTEGLTLQVNGPHSAETDSGAAVSEAQSPGPAAAGGPEGERVFTAMDPGPRARPPAARETKHGNWHFASLMDYRGARTTWNG